MSSTSRNSLNQLCRFCSAIFTLLLFLAASAPASLVLTGEVSPADPESWMDDDLDTGYIGKTAGNSGSMIVSGGTDVNSYEGYLGHEAGSVGTVTVRDWGTQWTTYVAIYVGYAGDGILTIENQGMVVSHGAVLGYAAGSNGMVRLRGEHTNWTNYSVALVGNNGTGTLIIEDGARMRNDAMLVPFPPSTGLVKVGGAGSELIVGSPNSSGASPFWMSGTLVVEDAGEAHTYGADMGGSGASATVAGNGSLWWNRGTLKVFTRGTLVVSEEGRVVSDELTVQSATANITAAGILSAQQVSVRENASGHNSLLAVDIGHGSLLSVDDGTGNLDNNGTVRLLAGPVPPAGSEHSPIAAGTWTGSGTYQALGGTWNGTSHVFTVSEMLTGVSGQVISIDLSDCQRALIEDPATGRAAGVSFLGKTGSGNSVDFTATALSPAEIAELDDLTAPQGLVFGGWNFAADGIGYDPTDPIYVSLEIPSNLNRNDFTVWHFDGSGWSNLAPHDLTCAGGYASFTTEGLAVFAIAVPEPSVTILLLVGLAFATPRRSHRTPA